MGNTAYQTSWAKVLSTCQPGDTALGIYGNWASRVLKKGEVRWALAGGLTLFFMGRVLNALSLSQPIMCVQLIMPAVVIQQYTNSNTAYFPMVGTTNKG
jgi:hypothetical protein